MDELSISRGGTIDARVVNTGKHEHLVAMLFTDLAFLADIHLLFLINKINF